MRELGVAFAHRNVAAEPGAVGDECVNRRLDNLWRPGHDAIFLNLTTSAAVCSSPTLVWNMLWLRQSLSVGWYLLPCTIHLTLPCAAVRQVYPVSPRISSLKVGLARAVMPVSSVLLAYVAVAGVFLFFLRVCVRSDRRLMSSELGEEEFCFGGTSLIHLTVSWTNAFSSVGMSSARTLCTLTTRSRSLNVEVADAPVFFRP